MRLPLTVLGCLASALPACAPDSGDEGLAVGVDAGAEDAGEADTGPPERGVPPEVPPTSWPPLPPDPSWWDCESLAWPLPERSSPVPLGCVTDPACEERMVVGHRGLGGEVVGYMAPENSLAVVRAAIFVGVDAVEVDVRHTADDALVVIHDSTVDRTLEGTGRVSELTLAELQAMRFRLEAPFIERYHGDYGCERIPTFREVLDLARGRVWIDVDVKTDRAEDVALAIRDAGMLDQAFFGSSSLEAVVRARAAVPELGLLIRPDAAGDLEAWLDALDRAPTVVEMDDGQLEPVLERIHGLGAKAFLNGWFGDAEALNRSFGGYERLWAQGADVLQSDGPLMLLQHLGRL